MTAPPPTFTPWRLWLLAIDEFPDRHATLYAQWEERGAQLTIEPSVEQALLRLRAQSPRFTLVLAPALGGGYQAMTDDRWFGPVLEQWILDYAPSYVGRVLYYGPPEVLRSAAVSAPPELPLLPLPRYPDQATIDNATRVVDATLERFAALKAAERARTEAEKLARRQQRLGAGTADSQATPPAANRD